MGLKYGPGGDRGPRLPSTEAALLGLRRTAFCTLSRDCWGLACPLAPLLRLPGLTFTPEPHAEPRQRPSLQPPGESLEWRLGGGDLQGRDRIFGARCVDPGSLSWTCAAPPRAPASWEGRGCSAGPQGRDCQQTGRLLPPPPGWACSVQTSRTVWGPGDAVCGPHRGLWSPAGLERTL